MKKILYISYFYGEGYASGIQNMRLVKALEARNVNCDVVCRFSNNNENERLRRIQFPEWKKLNTLQYWLFPGLNGIISIDQICWIIKVLIILRKKVKDFDIIHISSSPFFIQLLGYFLVKRSKRRWIVQLLDPISDNNYINTSRLGFFLLRLIEKFIVNNSNIILFNNRRMLSKYSERYPDSINKFNILFHVTNDEIITSDVKCSKITLYHIGSLSTLRKIDFLVHSLNLLRNEIGQLDDFQFVFIGTCSLQDKELVRKNNLESVIQFQDYMTFEEMNKKVSKADGLILIDALGVEGVFAASKLCEYFSFQKIIFAISPKEGVTSDILSESGHLCFDEGDEAKFAFALKNLIENRDFYVSKFDDSLYIKYLPERIAEEYLKIINKNEIQN